MRGQYGGIFKRSGVVDMKICRRKDTIEAYSFEEVIAHGLKSALTVVDGRPQAFEFLGRPISHERGDEYVVPTFLGLENFTPGHVLVRDKSGALHMQSKEWFSRTFIVIEDNLPIPGSTSSMNVLTPDDPRI